jgi:adenine-specific DNA-methyltransferase
MTSKALGQYFTVSNTLQKFVFEHVRYKNLELLEPSFGAGHLLKNFLLYNCNYPITCFEIDPSIEPIVEFNTHQKVIYGDFLAQKINQKFKTIIANPPYVKQRGTNLYIQFISKCFDCLDFEGEMVMIVPSDFGKLTSASKIIKKMASKGSFTNFLFPNNERLFTDATIDVMVFRYQKDIKQATAIVNNSQQFCSINNGIITFQDKVQTGTKLSSLFNIYVGIVSGKDSVFKQTFGNIVVLTDKDKSANFICIENFPCGIAEIDVHLIEHKDELLTRKIRKFTEKNWFEWGALRNIKAIKTQANCPCIFIRTMTRKKEVAFLDKVQPFGGGLLCIIPKLSMTRNETLNVVRYLNSDEFKNNHIYSGRFKIGQRQLCETLIPLDF